MLTSIGIQRFCTSILKRAESLREAQGRWSQIGTEWFLFQGGKRKRLASVEEDKKHIVQ